MDRETKRIKKIRKEAFDEINLKYEILERSKRMKGKKEQRRLSDFK